MDWLFERIIKLAAWVAFMLCIILFCDAVWMLVQWIRHYGAVEGSGFMTQGWTFVLSALALVALACIDRYVFDLPKDA